MHVLMILLYIVPVRVDDSPVFLVCFVCNTSIADWTILEISLCPP
jgi:hypothetical protein